MSNVEDKGRQNSKYDKFDKLDTATLEAILRADFDAPEAEQMAAEDMGSVSATPTSTETRMPIQKG